MCPSMPVKSLDSCLRSVAPPQHHSTTCRQSAIMISPRKVDQRAISRRVVLRRTNSTVLLIKEVAHAHKTSERLSILQLESVFLKFQYTNSMATPTIFNMPTDRRWSAYKFNTQFFSKFFLWNPSGFSLTNAKKVLSDCRCRHLHS
jgi:hypothetical protein